MTRLRCGAPDRIRARWAGLLDAIERRRGSSLWRARWIVRELRRGDLGLALADLPEPVRRALASRRPAIALGRALALQPDLWLRAPDGRTEVGLAYKRSAQRWLVARRYVRRRRAPDYFRNPDRATRPAPERT